MDNLKFLKKGKYIIDYKYNSENPVYKITVENNNYNYSYIIKIYKNYKHQKIEKKVLNSLIKRNVLVPKIIYSNNLKSYFEFIKGQTVKDLLDNNKTNEWIEELAIWYSKLHSIKNKKGSFLKSDNSLDNFIFSNNLIYGLDFETSIYGDYMKDIADICFNILISRQKQYKENILIIRKFLKTYTEKSNNSIHNFLNHFLERKAKNKM